MKKLIAIISLILLSIALAGTNYVEITFRMTNAKAQEFLTGFLEKCPIPMIADPNGDLNIPFVPQYTPKGWVKEWGRRQYVRAYGHGKDMLAKKAAAKEKDIFE